MAKVTVDEAEQCSVTSSSEGELQSPTGTKSTMFKFMRFEDVSTSSEKLEETKENLLGFERALVWINLNIDEVHQRLQSGKLPYDER